MHLLPIVVTAAGLLPGFVACHGYHAKRGVDCAFATSAGKGDTCASFASSWGLAVDDLIKLNPGISCPDITPGKDYCVIGEVNDIPDPTTTSSSSKPTTTSTTSKTTLSTSISTFTTSSSTTSAPDPSNSPAMPGLASNCNGFHKIGSGDSCDSIAARYGISVSQFRSWNTLIDQGCSNLWLGYACCVSVTGVSPGPTTTSTTKPPTSSPTNTSPEPQMPGIVSSCNRYYQIKSGDTCDAISTKNGISVSQFRSWNTLIDQNCSNLWLGYWCCVSASSAGTPTTTRPPASDPTNSNPQPQMPGIISSCKGFYKVKSGDTCDSIARGNGIDTAQFKKYNTYIDSQCSNLWLDYFVCVKG